MDRTEALAIRQRQLELLEKESKCGCEVKNLTRRDAKNGGIRVYEQCARCGSAKQISREGIDVDELPPRDELLARIFHGRNVERRNEIYREFNENLEQAARELNEKYQNAEWWKSYEKYLDSDDWRQLRRLVLTRDNHVCQACLRRPAVQVHHRSYAFYNYYGQSFAFELVSICLACHQAIHPRMAEAQGHSLESER